MVPVWIPIPWNCYLTLKQQAHSGLYDIEMLHYVWPFVFMHMYLQPYPMWAFHHWNECFDEFLWLSQNMTHHLAQPVCHSKQLGLPTSGLRTPDNAIKLAQGLGGREGGGGMGWWWRAGKRASINSSGTCLYPFPVSIFQPGSMQTCTSDIAE